MMQKVCPSDARELFPRKLYELLEFADEQGGQYSQAVRWLPNGCAFKILDQRKFMKSVAPRYFNQTNFRSFSRQLHLYGFQRVTEGAYNGAWYHKHFLRGHPEEIKLMVRVNVKSRAKQSQVVKDKPKQGPKKKSESSSSRRVSMDLDTPDVAPADEVAAPRSISLSPTLHDSKEIDDLADGRVSKSPPLDGVYCQEVAGPDAIQKTYYSMEPLPLDYDVPFDELSKCINNVIRVL